MVRGEASRLGQFFLAQERNCLCGGESPLTIFLAQERNCLCGFTPRTARTGSHWLHTLITLLKKKNCQGRLAPRTASHSYNTLKEKKLSGATRPPYGFVPYNTLKRKKIVRGDSPPLKEKNVSSLSLLLRPPPEPAGRPRLLERPYSLTATTRSL